MATRALTMLMLAQSGVACDHGEDDGIAHEPQDWVITPQPLLHIGAIDGDPAYQFHEIDTVLRLPNGRIVVANRGTHELRFYNAEGQYVRSIGSQGSGPGEFRDMGGLELVGGDSLYVFDPTLGRVSVIDTAGTFLDSFRLQSTDDDVRPLRMYRLAGVLETRDIVLVAEAWPADMKAVPTLHFDSMATLLYRPDGGLSGEVAEPLGMDTYATPERAGDLQFGRISSASVDSRFIYATDGGECDIRVYDPYSGLVRTMALDRPPRPVTRSDIDGMMSYYVGRVPNERKPSVRRYFEEWPRAEHKPWIDRLFIDAERYVWAPIRAVLEQSGAGVRNLFADWTARGVARDTAAILHPADRQGLCDRRLARRARYIVCPHVRATPPMSAVSLSGYRSGVAPLLPGKGRHPAPTTLAVLRKRSNVSEEDRIPGGSHRGAWSSRSRGAPPIEALRGGASPVRVLRV